MRSGWVAKLAAAYPKAEFETTVYVRGGGNCGHFRKEDRLAKQVIPRKPHLVLIGGISQKGVADTAEVIKQLRSDLPEVEVLLFTGTFGSTDPRDAEALAAAPHSGTGDYGKKLSALAAETGCAYLDMTTPWRDYLASSGLQPHHFYRDVIHANAFGEQVLAKILISTFATAAAETSDVERPVKAWVTDIQQEADKWYTEETDEFASIRLAAGWTMMNYSGKKSQAGEIAKELPKLTRWLEKDGYRMLKQILEGKPLAAEEESYRAITLALYLRAGIDYSKETPLADRALLLDLDRINSGRQACLRYREQVNQAGQMALRKGYLTGRLNAGDVDAIRLYRIAQAQRGVRECFLPAHLALHPMDDGKVRKFPGACMG
jgi:lysophospholipase L1-like esterase